MATAVIRAMLGAPNALSTIILLGMQDHRLMPVGSEASTQHAGRVPPRRCGKSGVQIAAREPDIRERVVVEVDQAPQLTPMFDGDDELPGTPRQSCDRAADRCPMFGADFRSWRDP